MEQGEDQRHDVRAAVDPAHQVGGLAPVEHGVDHFGPVDDTEGSDPSQMLADLLSRLDRIGRQRSIGDIETGIGDDLLYQDRHVVGILVGAVDRTIGLVGRRPEVGVDELHRRIDPDRA